MPTRSELLISTVEVRDDDALELIGFFGELGCGEWHPEMLIMIIKPRVGAACLTMLALLSGKR